MHRKREGNLDAFDNRTKRGCEYRQCRWQSLIARISDRTLHEFDGFELIERQNGTEDVVRLGRSNHSELLGR